jgi:integrase
MGRLLTFLLYTGCRIGEALALKWENISSREHWEVYIETSKNGDARTVRLTPDAIASLGPVKAAGRVFRFHQGGHRNFLFLNAKVTACGLPPVKRPKRGEKQIKPPYRLSWVTFHTFCHTWATWMRSFGGADLQGLVRPADGAIRDRRRATLTSYRTRNGIAPPRYRRRETAGNCQSRRRKRNEFNSRVTPPPKSWPQLFWQHEAHAAKADHRFSPRQHFSATNFGVR